MAVVSKATAKGADQEQETKSSDTATPSNEASTKADPSAEQQFQPQGVYHMQGGIERYLRTFPKGGFWSGKNYLFDKRMEQIPEYKDETKVEQEVSNKLNAKCCRCRQPWTSYRGKHKCSQTLCGVPVIVCENCQLEIAKWPQEATKLQCELCREGYRAPQHIPDLVALRLKAEKLVKEQQSGGNAEIQTKKKNIGPLCKDRLFISRLPLNVRKIQIEEWLGTAIQHLEWLTDHRTGAFYGSCFVQVDAKAVKALLFASQSTDDDSKLDLFPGTVGGRKRKRRRQQPKIEQAMERKGHAWPPEKETEFPPLGHSQLQ
ncbi:MAG: hypothetical protein SGILL_004975 [Bacillariaceae sp.]